MKFGESLDKFFSDSFNLVLFRVCFLVIVLLHQKSPPVLFCFKKLASVPYVPWSQRSLSFRVWILTMKTPKFCSVRMELEDKKIDVPGLINIMDAEKEDCTRFYCDYNRYCRDLERRSRDLDKESELPSMGSLLMDSIHHEDKWWFARKLGLRDSGELSDDVLADWVWENSHFKELESVWQGEKIKAGCQHGDHLVGGNCFFLG